MSDVNRVSTGIPGLDDLIDGGFPEGSVTLISGGAGCGKTIFCSQYLWHGLENGENCRFVSLEESVDDIKSDAKVFGWDFEKHEEDGSLKISYITPTAGERGFLDKVNDLASAEGVTRLVIDSVSILLGSFGGEESEKRDNMYRLIRRVKRSDATTLLTSEILDDEQNKLSRYGVAEFVADGVIALYYGGMSGETFRNLEVRKMRKTAHTPGTYPFKITDEGINVSSDTQL